MTKEFCPDDLLGQIANKQHEIFRRAKEGTIEPTYLLNSLQKIIEGDHHRLPPWTWSGLKMEIRDVDGITIVDLDGELTVGERCVNFRKRFEDHLKKFGPGQANSIINCEKLSRIDRSGMMALVDAQKAVSCFRGRVCLLATNNQVHDILAHEQVLGLFQQASTEETALATFN